MNIEMTSNRHHPTHCARAEKSDKAEVCSSAHVFLFNSRGQLLIRQKSAGASHDPLCVTSSVSIVIAADEDSDMAAARELKQTLGLVATLEFLATLAITPETPEEVTQFYRAYTDARPVPDAHEIESIEFVDLERLVRQMTSDPHRFTHEFRTLIRWYRENVME